MDLKYELYRVIFSNKVYNLLFRPFNRLLYPLVDAEALKRRRQTEAMPLRLRRGKHQLLFDLERELIAWFAPHGNRPVTVEVEIV